MAMDNSVTLTGNVTRDVDLRFTPGGQAVASFGLAVNRRWQNRQTNEWEEAVTFVDITVWAEMAENAAESIYKGDRVTVVGRLDMDSWEDKDTGDKRTKLKVVAEDISISLKWGQVKEFQKNEKKERGSRDGGGGRGSRDSGGRDGGSDRGRDSGGRGGRDDGGRGGRDGGGRGRDSARDDSMDEEPF